MKLLVAKKISDVLTRSAKIFQERNKPGFGSPKVPQELKKPMK